MKVDSKRIRETRTGKAWSQEHLAEVSGLGLRTIQRIENGANASLESVAALSSVLAIPVAELVIREEPQKPGFANAMAAKRLYVIPVAWVIASVFGPPEFSPQAAVLLAFWVCLEIYLAVAARKKSRG